MTRPESRPVAQPEARPAARPTPRPTPRPVVLNSYNAPDDTRCVDLFRRPDGSFGFEECRRDPEDGRGWARLNHFGHQRFDSAATALEAARASVPWLSAVLP